MYISLCMSLHVYVPLYCAICHFLYIPLLYKRPSIFTSLRAYILFYEYILLFVCPFVYVPLYVCPSVGISLQVYIFLCVRLSLRMYIFLSVYLSVCISFYGYIHLYIYCFECKLLYIISLYIVYYYVLFHI